VDTHYLHCAIVFYAGNLNYGENFSNICSLKKMVTKGKAYSYMSRQAIRYDIVRLLNEMYDRQLAQVVVRDKVVQFADEATIENCPEIDFFGYMKTSKNTKKRSGIVRVSNAVSLEPFHNELDFGTNNGMSSRLEKTHNGIFQKEIHNSFYSYCATADLRQIGEDLQDKTSIDPAQKAIRMTELLDVIKLLYRDIKGSRENLSPVMVIGGLYPSGNPFFYNRINLKFTKEGTQINANTLNSVLTLTAKNDKVIDFTQVGAIDDVFCNIDQLDVKSGGIETWFANVSAQVNAYYTGS